MKSMLEAVLRQDHEDFDVEHEHFEDIPGFGRVRSGSSELHASINHRTKTMTLLSLRVHPSAQGKGLATQMISQAQQKAKALGYPLKTSGVYSREGRALMQSLVRKGMAKENSDGGHDISWDESKHPRDENGRWT